MLQLLADDENEDLDDDDACDLLSRGVEGRRVVGAEAMHFQATTTTMMMMVATLLLVAAVAITKPATAIYPNIPPFVDQCMGTTQARCVPSLKPQCTWSNDGAPSCYETNYLAQVPARMDNVSFTSRFFQFAYGVHMAEGNVYSMYMTDSTEECARLCFASAGVSGIRCLSFDYYPVEDPQPQAPYFETIETGVCVLNSENKDTGRLRNVDMGLTDSELFAKSHFTARPSSGLEGYYELRDPRGGMIADMLGYSGDVTYQMSVNWAKSRWGLYHLCLLYTSPSPRDRG